MRISQVLLGAIEKARAGPSLGLTRLPGGRRTYQLLDRALSRVQRRVATGDTEIEALGFHFFIDLSDRQIAAELLRTGTYEPVETALFAKIARPGMAVIDIGANIGIYTLIAASSVGPTGKVFAFEPNPGTANLLRRNVAANRATNVLVEEAAVARAAGSADLFTVADHPGLDSLNSGNARRSATSVSVRTVSLDDYCAAFSVDLLKIDAQGAESEIVAGARRTLERDRPIVFAELWLAGLRNMGSDGRSFLASFADLGYRIATIDRPDELLGIDETLTLAEPAGGLDVVLWP